MINIDSDSNAIVSTNIVEIDTQGFEDIEIRNSNLMVAGMDNNYDVQVENLDDLDITVAKKEYVITGDDIYIPQLYDDAPQWMKDLVGLVVDVSMTTNSTKLINDMNAMLQEFAVSYVPLNQYTQSILDLGNEDMRLNALIETLNSNFSNGLSNANAQIINLQMTKASKDEVLAQVIQTLAAELANPNSNLGATVNRLEQAITTEQTARATSFQALTASMESTNGEIEANAQALRNTMAYVGVDEAGASTETGLSAYLGKNGVIGSADSKVTNSVYTDNNGNVKSKYEYGSTLVVNGRAHNSGFGLVSGTSAGTTTNINGTNYPVFKSKFWVKADEFEVTNGTTGHVPFRIEGNKIKFNGEVSFENITEVPQLGSTPEEVVQAVNNGQTTTINGGRLTTGSVTAKEINVNDVFAQNITYTGTITGGNKSGGGIIRSYNGKMTIDLVNGSIYIS